MSELLLAGLVKSGGFACDPRFAPLSDLRPATQALEDPLTQAHEQGRAAGRAEAEAQAQQAADEAAAARAHVELAVARLDAEQAEQLRQRLLIVIEALCAETLAPLVVDRPALVKRIERAVAMLARADDEKILRLHPDDLALIARQLPAGLATEADPALERGALRIETPNGGVEDGPAHWRRAIAEALAQC